AALTASAMASPRPAATIRRLAAFSLVLIVALLLSQVSTPAFKVWMASEAPRPRLHRLQQFGRRALWGRGRLARSWGTERGANGPPGLPEHPNASRRCRRWENLSSPPRERSQRWKPGFSGCCAPAREPPRRQSGYA